MSLRAKLLALFGALAVVPLLAVGVFDYVRSLRALETLLVTQTSVIAERAASEMSDRFRAVEADVSLLADNAETRTLFTTRVTDRRWTVRRDSMARFVEGIWDRIGINMLSASYLDSAGRELYRVQEPEDVPAGQRTYVMDREIAGSGRSIGRVRAIVWLDSLMPLIALATRFGHGGYSAVLDDRSDTVLYAGGGGGIPPGLGADDEARQRSVRQQGITWFSYAYGDSTFVGARVRLLHPPLSVVTAASRDEFAAPFTGIRNSNLFAVVLLTLLVAAAFVALLLRGTRPLTQLTAAAGEVARGNLEPRLPQFGSTEVGQLSHAFGYMLERIRAMLAEVERSRKMAVIGEFAAQISHEIRNPLTSIKLNLQKVDRAARQGAVPAELRRPVEISLAEIQRLDRVVSGVLRLGRTEGSARHTFTLRDAVSRAVDAARPLLERDGIRVETVRATENDLALGDSEMLQATIANLLNNAREAMPGGGQVLLAIEPGASGFVRLRVEDDGPGVDEGDRERIFAPFYTTKADGTGLGLALAQRTMERHGGSIAAVAPNSGRGAAFSIELPLARGKTG